MPIIANVSKQTENFFETEQHVDARSSRIVRDTEDDEKFLNPFPVVAKCMYISPERQEDATLF